MNVEGNEVHLEGVATTFPTYKAYGSPETVDRALEYANPLATCAVIETDDAIIVAKRSIMNDPYGGDIGLVGGYIDNRHIGETKGLPRPVDNTVVEQNIRHEVEHELVLQENEMQVESPNGIVIDLEKIHTELTTTVHTNIDPEEIALRAVRTDPRDFSEKIASFPKSEASYNWLLTECLNPIPETHKANLVASGYAFIRKTRGEDYAQQWLHTIEEGVRQLKERQNKMVRDFYQQHPEAAREQRGKNPPRYTGGYDANYHPEEQGLPSIEEALNDAAEKGLVPKERKIPVASIFDIDGVIANPETRQADREQLLRDIADMLERDEIVGFNTGRSLAWVKNTILQKLETKVTDPAKLRNLIVMGEVGSAWIRYDENGERHESIDRSLALPDMPHPQDPTRNIRDDIREAFEKYAGTMFVDYTKEAMFTAEQNVGANREAFKKDQADVAAEIRALLTEYGLDKDFQVDPTNIATDVINKRQGKHLGVQRILNLMRYRRIQPEHIDTFGDSKSDIKMAQEAKRQGYSIRFIATARELEETLTPEETEGIDIVFTNAQLDAGTEEYLNSRLGRAA